MAATQDTEQKQIPSTFVTSVDPSTLNPDPLAPWEVIEEDGTVHKMAGHYGRPGTVAYVVTRRTHPLLAPGDVVVVYPNAVPDDEDTILVKRRDRGLCFIETSDRREDDEFRGVAWEHSVHFTNAAREMTSEDRRQMAARMKLASDAVRELRPGLAR